MGRDIAKIKDEYARTDERRTMIQEQMDSKTRQAAGRRLTNEETKWLREAEGVHDRLQDQLYALAEELRGLEGTPKPITALGGSGAITSPGNGFKSFGEQMLAVARAGTPGCQTDPRLYNAATGLSETVPSDGGFLVQTDYGREILRDAIETGKLAKRCRRQPIGANSNSIKINGVDETSRASSRYGGLVSYWLDEAAEKQASKPKFRQIELALKKSVVLCYATDELLADATALEAFLRDACPKEIAFSVDDAILNGTGAGQPLGILNAGCLVTVSKEVGQAASTIVAENVINMVARTLGDSSSYVWLYNKTVLPQIYSLSLAVGTGGIPLFMAGGSIPSQPENRLLGLPLIECEQCQTLGTAGDLILANLGDGYILADKGAVEAAVSIHVKFVYDESVFRFVYRVDGQPSRASALTPFKGGANYTQSHFVVIESRS